MTRRVVIVGFSGGVTSAWYAEGWERTFGDSGEKSDEQKAEDITSADGRVWRRCEDPSCPDLEHPEDLHSHEVKPAPCFVCGATDHVPDKGFVGKSMVPDTDAIECRLGSYANYVVQGPAVSIPDPPVYRCAACCDTGCVADPNADPSTFVTEADGLVNCDECAIRGKQLP